MRRFVTVLLAGFVMVGAQVLVTGGPANALCVGSSLCNPANAPLLAGTGGAVPSIGAGATATGSTATSAVLATGGSTAATGISSTLPSALGGTAGLVLAGAGVLGYNLLQGGDADLPGAGGSVIPGETRTFNDFGGTAYKWGAADPIWVDMTTVATFVVNETTSQPGLQLEVSAPAQPDGPCGMGSANYCDWVDGWQYKLYRQCSGGAWSNFVSGSERVNEGSPEINTRYVPTSGGTGCAPASVTGLRLELKPTETVSDYQLAWEIDLTTTAPSRTLETTIRCKDSLGEVEEVTQTVDLSEWTPSTPVEVPQLQCPEGDRLVDVERRVLTEGEPEVDLGRETVPPELDLIPQRCFESGIACELDLQKRVQGTWTELPNPDADPAPGPGPDSWGDLNPETWPQVESNPETWRCRMGQPGQVSFVVVPLQWCQTMVPEPSGQKTPVPVSNPEPNPAPSPGASPGGEGCLSWGDVWDGSIMYKAVGCALVWAFVPTEGKIQTELSRVENSWSQSEVGQFFESFSVLPGMFNFGGSANCEGPVFSFRPVEDGELVTVKPLYSCDGFAQTMSTFSKAISFVVVGVVGAMGIARLLGYSFGMRSPGTPEV